MFQPGVTHVLAASAQRVADGQTSGVVFGPCLRAYLLVDVTAVGAGNMDLYLEMQDEDAPTKWYAIAGIAGIAATGQYLAAVDCPPDVPCRLRWDLAGGADLTFSAKLREAHC